MTPLESVNYAMAAIATGGFSTKNASVGFYDSISIEMILSLFMYLGALPMTFYIVLVQRRDLHSFRTAQVAVFTKVLAFYILLTAVWLAYEGIYDSFGSRCVTRRLILFRLRRLRVLYRRTI